MNSPTPLRLAHVDTGPSLRGGQRQMLMLAAGLRRRGHEQVIVCLEGSAVEDQAQREGYRVLALPPHDPWHAFGVMLWRQQMQSWMPQIIHAHDGRGQTLAWLASLGMPLRRVASRRVTFFPSGGWTYRWKYTRTCHAVVAVSESIRELSVQAGVPRERIAVIPDGIEAPADLPSVAQRQRVRGSWQCDDEHFLVGLLGAASPEKGWDLAVAAVAMLSEKLPKLRLVTAGDDCDRFGHRAIHHERILRLGAVNDLADFLPGLDLFLMPSRAEGLGSSALWAMSYGLPVIATKVGGLPEIVADGETGWLTPPGSPQALADALYIASTDRARLREFGRRGRRRVESFSADIMVGRTEALYRRLLSADFPNGLNGHLRSDL